MPYDKPKSFITSAGLSAGLATILMYCLSGSGKSLKFLKLIRNFDWLYSRFEAYAFSVFAMYFSKLIRINFFIRIRLVTVT